MTQFYSNTLLTARDNIQIVMSVGGECACRFKKFHTFLDYLMELDVAIRHREIIKHMVFIDTPDIKDTLTPVMQATYSCIDDRCDFVTALLLIQTDQKLSQWKTPLEITELCMLLVGDIAANEMDYLPHKVDGYYIRHTGFPLVHLKREGSEGRGITGSIEYEALKKGLILHEKKSNAGIISTHTSDTKRSRVGCLVS